MKPRIEGVAFGAITINGETYAYDVVIDAEGKVRARNKKPSKQKFGTSHRLARAEFEEYFGEEAPALLIVGTGHSGMLEFSEGSMRFARERGIEVRFLATPEAARAFNDAPEGTGAILHVTC